MEFRELAIEDKTSKSVKEYSVASVLIWQFRTPGDRQGARIPAGLPDGRKGHHVGVRQAEQSGCTGCCSGARQGSMEGLVYSMHPGVHPFQHEKIALTLVAEWKSSRDSS